MFKLSTSVLIPFVLSSVSLAQAAAPAINADIHDRSGATVGHVTARAEKNGMTFVITAKGLKPGMHGMHIHANGKCEGPDFKSAGPHFAFAGQMHGMDNPKGPHLGDMPNLNVKPDGTAKLRFHSDLVTLGSSPNALNKSGGTALIIHDKQDDQDDGSFRQFGRSDRLRGIVPMKTSRGDRIRNKLPPKIADPITTSSSKVADFWPISC